MKKLILLSLLVSGCSVVGPSEKEEVPHVVIDGQEIELVSDEYGNQYLRQNIDGYTYYTPFPFETEEEEPQSKTLQVKRQ